MEISQTKSASAAKITAIMVAVSLLLAASLFTFVHGAFVEQKSQIYGGLALFFVTLCMGCDWGSASDYTATPFSVLLRLMIGSCAGVCISFLIFGENKHYATGMCPPISLLTMFLLIIASNFWQKTGWVVQIVQK